ncbi:hypothetical protein F3N42_00985 [Marinihelvus fidelis]|uniref:Uncharacterized protein n=1 Tax=Marinihelvus fidelis TaxID=2613842 RepID=A0A5N0TLF0_9GAMM|nr:hypothetical protein [Marinihelvus fidelis]KAA9134149.1 hypothetical protein F3N42_00985 [Marinihelvus fidelis]
MSEFEQVSLFFQIVSVGNGTMANYMTLVFGMLVTSYLAAHRIDRVMMWIALVIYSMFALGFCNEIYQVYSDFSRLGIVLAERGQLPQSGLGWFGPVATSADALPVIPWMVLAMTLLAYVGSVAFFFRARRSAWGD